LTERYFPTKTDCVAQADEWLGIELYGKSETRKMLKNSSYLGSKLRNP
jgi:hypothetical protein